MRNYVMVCGRCYEEADVFTANCAERPEDLRGQPLGQYHCPDCGAMVVAGIAHPALCRRCLDRVHPDIDEPAAIAACTNGLGHCWHGQGQQACCICEIKRGLSAFYSWWPGGA